MMRRKTRSDKGKKRRNSPKSFEINKTNGLRTNIRAASARKSKRGTGLAQSSGKGALIGSLSGATQGAKIGATLGAVGLAKNMILKENLDVGAASKKLIAGTTLGTGIGATMGATRGAYRQTNVNRGRNKVISKARSNILRGRLRRSVL